MKNFRGRLISHAKRSSGDTVTMGIDDDWLRVWNAHKRIGAWRLDDVACERVTVFRFSLNLDGIAHTFTPDDPAGFADAIGAIIDLRPKSRFGLGDRVRAAKAAIATEEADSASG